MVMASGTASAQSDTQREARDAFSDGLAHGDANRWPQAVAAFRQSLALFERQSTRLNLGTALIRAGHPVEAATVLGRVVEAERASTRPDTEMIENAERELATARAAIAHVALDISPSDARVELDGREVARNQRRDIQVDPGVVRFRVAMEGHTEAMDAITLVPGERVARRIALVSLLPDDANRMRLTDERGSSVFEAPWFWIVTGIVVVGAGVAIGVVASSQSGPAVEPGNGPRVEALIRWD